MPSLKKLFALNILLAGSFVFAQNSSPERIFADLLSEYRKNPECFGKLTDGINEFTIKTSIDVQKVPSTIMEPRYKDYNVKYQLNRNLERKLIAELADLKVRLSKTPLSDSAKRVDLELKNQAQSDRLSQTRRNICLLSVDANLSFKDAEGVASTLPQPKVTNEKDTAGSVVAPTTPKVVDAATPPPAPVASKPKSKMPGIMGGERDSRSRLLESEKINLTPVDAEFYATQLGRKLESDLKGRADAWSYDYAKDELYIKVGNEVGKVLVVNDPSGTRVIKTRVGSNYIEPRGSDVKVDLMEAKGRFLTGDAREETLFGIFPRNDPRFVDDKKSGETHNPHDGHDH